MKMFSAQFMEQDSYQIEYKGDKVFAYYPIDLRGEFILKFEFIKSNSEFTQAIIFHLDSFEGELYINNNLVQRSKRKFAQLIFDEKTTPKRFEVKVVQTGGKFRVCNGADLLGDEKIWRSLYGGCAMIIEKINEKKLRFHCNDFENDDDFDDLIFDMEIIKL